ncbi:5-methylthioribose kinase [Algoriphagus ratkowskyi]|uniref:5-methylthioribose kinase n=1 Tax=Algoriphagus ratkowskyi TaxID=57028 RepID=A0A2W7R3U3_9BACT|nr:phosphotransferase [Algoriphagus ratkowskyi]PZX55493.1 5-methylthioribose kinase [Algoriphagus ratkowskyi]TXD79590.1 phosphotransferase [Algoriphagus ratkowskyi]
MIDLTEQSSLELLHSLPLWKQNEILISSESAGDSNMNLVLRVKTNSRSVILKQSKSFVRKFPQIPAPIERIEIELRYYQLFEDDELLSSCSPKVIIYNKENHILLLEDLGNGTDFSAIYAPDYTWDINDFHSLSQYLNSLHDLQVSNFPENVEMKKLNHEHLFHYPFMEENGFDLDTIQPGLQDLSLAYKRDTQLKSALELLGKRYLSQGTTLLHGDFYPASWLKTANGVKFIDTEFAYMGDREFDLGVLFAHFALAKMDARLQSDFLKIYQHSYSELLVNAYLGMEIMRRLIGIAQLPLSLTLADKKLLLERARKLILAQ